MFATTKMGSKQTFHQKIHSLQSVWWVFSKDIEVVNHVQNSGKTF